MEHENGDVLAAAEDLLKACAAADVQARLLGGVAIYLTLAQRRLAPVGAVSTDPGVASLRMPLVALGLLLMMYPVLAKVRYEELGRKQHDGVSDRLFFGVSLFLSWVVGPLLMFALAWLLLPNQPAYRTGVIVVGLAIVVGCDKGPATPGAGGGGRRGPAAHAVVGAAAAGRAQPARHGGRGDLPWRLRRSSSTCWRRPRSAWAKATRRPRSQPKRLPAGARRLR